MNCKKAAIFECARSEPSTLPVHRFVNLLDSVNVAYSKMRSGDMRVLPFLFISPFISTQLCETIVFALKQMNISASHAGALRDLLSLLNEMLLFTAV